MVLLCLSLGLMSLCQVMPPGGLEAPRPEKTSARLSRTRANTQSGLGFSVGSWLLHPLHNDFECTQGWTSMARPFGRLPVP